MDGGGITRTQKILDLLLSFSVSGLPTDIVSPEEFWEYVRQPAVDRWLKEMIDTKIIPLLDRRHPETWSPKERAEANLAAMRLLASKPGPFSDQERKILARYSGWGGIGTISKYQEQFPPTLAPEARGLLHEYYTPSKVWRAVAKTLARFRDSLPRMTDGNISALEPSAGIGRALRAFKGWPAKWTALEASAVSARLLSAVWPGAEIHQGYAEGWIAANPGRKFGLVAANPPYGARGAARELDPDGYATAQAYIYFVVRTAGMLEKGGIACYIIPTGFMSSRVTAFQRHREALLKRAHLMAAFRLPSQPLPGGDASDIAYDNFPVDVIFVKGRGGIAETVPDADQAIIAGDYYEEHPDHILGTEIRTGEPEADEDEGAKAPPKVRRGYQVQGRFEGFPEWEPREEVVVTVSNVVRKGVSRGGISRDTFRELAEDAPPALREAERLGAWADRFLEAAARGLATAEVGQRELILALESWQQTNGNPALNQQLQRMAESGNLGIKRFLAIWKGGRLIPAITKPVEKAGYQGPQSLVSLTEWLYKQGGAIPLSIEKLATEAQKQGIAAGDAQIREQLWPAGWWFLDDSHIEPKNRYLEGFLWPKHDYAAQRKEDPLYAEQTRELRAKIGWRGGAALLSETSPTQPWIPFDVLLSWLRLPDALRWEAKTEANGIGWPEAVGLKRQDGLLMPDTVGQYGALANTDKSRTPGFSRDHLCFIGWCNNDNLLFTPPQKKNLVNEVIPAPEVRKQMIEVWNSSWQQWLEKNDTALENLEFAYNRKLSGYIAPVWPTEAMPIARWGTKITLHPYQWAGIWQLVANHCGLLSFDVGLGKTYSAIATIAIAKQQGWARRPVVVVPNTICWKWVRDFATCLPDYKVLVVGANRRKVSKETNRFISDAEAEKLGEKKWRWRSVEDTPAERGQKWSEFQAGEYDVAIVTYSALGRQQIDPKFVERYVGKTVAVRRAITLALDTSNTEKGKEPAPIEFEGWLIYQDSEGWRAFAEGKGDATIVHKGKKVTGLLSNPYVSRDLVETALQRYGATKKQSSRRTERQEADTQERVRAWVGAQLAPPSRWKYDEGVDWHQFGVDLMVVDEAQNFKNLFYSTREGGEGRNASKRSWQLDFRCASVREHSGGAGVILLSATPMKNAAAEFYNLLHLVNPAIWEQVGLQDPESFINMFAAIKPTAVTGGNGMQTTREQVVGFMHKDILRNLVYRWATFKNAVEVGLPLPSVDRRMHIVRPTEWQRETFTTLLKELDTVEEDLKQVFAASAAAKAKGKEQSKALQALKNKKQGIHSRLYLTAIHPGLTGGSTEPSASPKLVECSRVILDNVKASLQACKLLPDGSNFCLDCGHLVFCQNVEVHAWLKALLVAGGIPAERIAILNAKEAEDLEYRQQVAMGFNGNETPDSEEYVEPQYDVVIANSVAEEGIDLQRRTCAIHHLDVPWEFATLQQRNGRAVRQGNQFKEITVHYYLVAGSSEQHRLDKIERKRGIMLSLYESGDLSTNTVNVDAVEGEDDISDAFLDFAPPEVRARMSARAIEAREEAKKESDRKARLSANSQLREAVIAKRRLDAATVGDADQIERRTKEYNEAVSLLAGYPSTLWAYAWRDLATEALSRSSQDVWVGATGPALFPGAQIEGDLNGETRSWQVTYVDGDAVFGYNGSGFQRIPVQQLEITKAAFKPYTDQEWKDAAAKTTVYQQWAGSWDTDTWLRYGVGFQSAIWPKYAKSFRSLKVGSDPLPDVEYGELKIRETGSEITLGLPPTIEGWREFLTLVAGQKKLKWTALNQAALHWWGKPLPQGLVGADL